MLDLEMIFIFNLLFSALFLQNINTAVPVIFPRNRHRPAPKGTYDINIVSPARYRT